MLTSRSSILGLSSDSCMWTPGKIKFLFLVVPFSFYLTRYFTMCTKNRMSIKLEANLKLRARLLPELYNTRSNY